MGRTEQGRPRRRQKKRMQRHRRSVLAVSAVVLLLFVVISANSVSLKATDEYVEDVAKEKLGLIHENETIFKAE